jgi:hypothetical protein
VLKVSGSNFLHKTKREHWTKTVGAVRFWKHAHKEGTAKLRQKSHSPRSASFFPQKPLLAAIRARSIALANPCQLHSELNLVRRAAGGHGWTPPDASGMTKKRLFSSSLSEKGMIEVPDRRKHT